MSRAEPQAAKRQERTRRGAPCTTAIELCTRRRRSRLVLNLNRSLNLNLSDPAAIKIKIKSKSKIKKVVGKVNSTAAGPRPGALPHDIPFTVDPGANSLLATARRACCEWRNA